MATCSAITKAGARCKASAMEGYQWCFNHHPELAKERSANARRGGRSGVRVALTPSPVHTKQGRSGASLSDWPRRSRKASWIGAWGRSSERYSTTPSARLGRS